MAVTRARAPTEHERLQPGGAAAHSSDDAAALGVSGSRPGSAGPPLTSAVGQGVAAWLMGTGRQAQRGAARSRTVVSGVLSRGTVALAVGYVAGAALASSDSAAPWWLAGVI